MSLFATGDVDGRKLTDTEICWLLLLLLLGGNETTTALLTNVLWRLLEVPQRWDAVRDRPDAVDAAIEESLRHDPPVLGMFRTTTTEIVRHDVVIRARRKVMLCYGAANHDGAVFADPDTFRIERRRGRAPAPPRLRLRRPLLPRRGTGPPRGQGDAAGTRAAASGAAGRLA